MDTSHRSAKMFAWARLSMAGVQGAARGWDSSHRRVVHYEGSVGESCDQLDPMRLRHNIRLAKKETDFSHRNDPTAGTRHEVRVLYFALGGNGRIVGYRSFGGSWSADTDCPHPFGSRALSQW